MENTKYGNGTLKHVSPELKWTGAPAGTQSFAIVFQDLSANISHWAIWNIPASENQLPAALPGTATLPAPAGARQVGIGGGGYFGPGAVCNVYEFVIYALSEPAISISGDQGAARTAIRALGTTILGQTSIRARSDNPCS